MARSEEKPEKPHTSPGGGSPRPPRAPRIHRPDLLVDLEKGRTLPEKRSRGSE